MTAQELLELTDEELDRVPLDEIQRILADEREKLARLERRRASLEDASPKSLREVADLMGISPERVRQLQTVAMLKIRDQFPELKDILKA